MIAPRCGAELNRGLHEAMAAHPGMYVLGEDLLDPYGGAFKITKGLSDRWPDRVITTPISEASLFGVAAGMSMRGLRPVLEIMFGDFITLGFDQIVNGISKFREMYDDQVTLPMVVRTPMGGRRGYGPTHSQSLEKFLIENKVMYGRPNRRPRDGRIGELDCVETAGPYPALTFSGSCFTEAAATLVAYGGMVPIALDAATELIVEHEVFCEVVAISGLLPLDVDPVLASLSRSGVVVTLEEGTLTGGVGAEIAARVQERGWDDLRRPVVRVAARDGIIPSAPTLEEAVLPGVADVTRAVLAAVGARA